MFDSNCRNINILSTINKTSPLITTPLLQYQLTAIVSCLSDREKNIHIKYV